VGGEDRVVCGEKEENSGEKGKFAGKKKYIIGSPWAREYQVSTVLPTQPP
jgi:hypothetical protein